MAEQNEGPKPEETVTVTDHDGKVISAERALAPTNQYRTRMTTERKPEQPLPSSLQELANGAAAGTESPADPSSERQSSGEVGKLINTDAYRTRMNGPKDES